MWREIRKLIAVREKEFYRTNLLLRVIIYQLFECKLIKREFWEKYISSVNNLISYVYQDEKEVLARFNIDLNRIVLAYRDQSVFQGTDWTMFYKDPECEKISLTVIHDIATMAKDPVEKTMPAIWFTVTVERRVNPVALFNHFRKSLERLMSSQKVRV